MLSVNFIETFFEIQEGAKKTLLAKVFCYNRVEYKNAINCRFRFLETKL